MNIKLVYHLSTQTWTAHYEKEFGVGITLYEAIGRLICVLAQTRGDYNYTIELEE